MSKNTMRLFAAITASVGLTGLALAACNDTNPPVAPSVKKGASAGTAKRGGPTQAPAAGGKTGNGATLGNVVSPGQSVTPPPTGDPCGGLSDGTAWCASDTSVGYCSGGASHAVDCTGYASSDTQWKFDAGGFCYETPAQIDCLLCFTAPDKSIECCDASLSICCDAATGACFLPAPG